MEKGGEEEEERRRRMVEGGAHILVDRYIIICEDNIYKSINNT